MKALVIEDNESVSRLVKEGFQAAGWTVDTALSGEVGLMLALDAGQAYDLAIVDRMLPVIDGMAIVRGMREKGVDTPVIMLTALGSVENRIEGLDVGATLAFGDLCLDPENRTLAVAGKRAIDLSGRESAMLEALIAAGGSPLSRDRLLAKVWGVDRPVEAANVDNYAYFLRRKLKGAESSVRLESIRGLGYRLVEAS